MTPRMPRGRRPCRFRYLKKSTASKRKHESEFVGRNGYAARVVGVDCRKARRRFRRPRGDCMTSSAANRRARGGAPARHSRVGPAAIYRNRLRSLAPPLRSDAYDLCRSLPENAPSSNASCFMPFTVLRLLNWQTKMKSVIHRILHLLFYEFFELRIIGARRFLLLRRFEGIEATR